MSITAPYSLQLSRSQDARDAVAGSVPDVVSSHFKIFLGDDVPVANRQSYVGSLRAVYRHLMNELVKTGAPAAKIGYAAWDNAAAQNIILTQDHLDIGLTDVAIVVPNNFASPGKTHFFTETFNQLINVLLERTKDN